jgi:hypothetical protein
MRILRRTRSRVIIALEIIFVCLTIYFYKQTSPLPHVRPAQQQSPVSKTLVIASTTQGNTTWLSDVNPDWTILPYISDDPNADLTVPVNRGNEAMVYLTYIIDNYEQLPDVVLFHHDHLMAWHQQFDSITEVNNLQSDFVLEEGYVSIRCLQGCQNYIPLSQTVVSMNVIETAGRELQIPTFLRNFLGEDYHMPEVIAAPCCAQFAATKEAIRARPKEFWERLQKWLIETPLDSAVSGRLIEYTWHLIFQKEAML